MISCWFRALQRLTEEALECAPHRCTSCFNHDPVQCREGRGRSIRQSAVRPFVIVVFSELRQLLPCVGERNKPLHVQTFVSEPAVEALDESVLHGSSRPNEAQLY